ncbi:MAG: putative xanthine dehydrogenase subunit A [Anaerolineae bacterium]|nr:putative xanthine dehydrogenase subunit A [Anaerolineae bacterium]MDL1896446.1 XdhC family protein [Anaerolineae bacterium CFX7]RIK30075.1 MAG: xanthine dehydrogenase [Chloroflexota bacterium]
MDEILDEIQTWRARGDDVALATVVWTGGSTPRAIGAKMAVNARGEFVGSVSGGCVEGAVIDQARAVLKSGKPQLLNYGISDDMAWDVGLACGGSIQVFVEKI